VEGREEAAGIWRCARAVVEGVKGGRRGDREERRRYKVERSGRDAQYGGSLWVVVVAGTVLGSTLCKRGGEGAGMGGEERRVEGWGEVTECLGGILGRGRRCGL